MQLITPPEITIQTYPYGWKNQQRLAVTLLMGVPLHNGYEPAAITGLPYSAQDMWQAIADNIANDAVFDIGFPKPKAEYLVYGKFHALEGFAVSASDVEIRFKDLKKRLTVTGPRFWRKILTPTTPEPITELEISYGNAFGGENYLQNPTGIGFDPSSGDPLPQVEYHNDLVSRPGHTPKPASLGATSVDWMPRKKLWGSYGDHWQKHEAPFFASNIQPDFFMQAAPDQWLPHHLQGNEPYLIKNMHPSFRQIEGRLPAFHFHLLAQVSNKPDQLLDCPADTVLFLPEANMAVLIARAELPIGTFDGEEVSLLQAAYTDRNEEKKPITHYQEHAHARVNDLLDDDQIENYQPLRPESVSALFMSRQALSTLSTPDDEKSAPLPPGTAAIGALGLGGLLAAAAKAAAAKGGTGGSASASPDSVTSESADAGPSPEEVAQKFESAMAKIKEALAQLGISPEQLDDVLNDESDDKAALMALLKEKFPDSEDLAALDGIQDNPAQASQLAEQKTQQGQQALQDQLANKPDSMSDEQHQALKRTLAGEASEDDLKSIPAEEVDQHLDTVMAELNRLHPLTPQSEDKPPSPDDIAIDLLKESIKKILKGDR